MPISMRRKIIITEEKNKTNNDEFDEAGKRHICLDIFAPIHH